MLSGEGKGGGRRCQRADGSTLCTHFGPSVVGLPHNLTPTAQSSDSASPGLVAGYLTKESRIELSPSGRPSSRNPVDESIGLLATVDSSRFAPLRAAAAFLEPGSASSIPPVTKQNRLQCAAACLRRCSLAFMISLMSPAGRISKMLQYLSAGCWPISCTAWFMSLASRTRMPPSSSFVSA